MDNEDFYNEVTNLLISERGFESWNVPSFDEVIWDKEIWQVQTPREFLSWFNEEPDNLEE